MLPRSLSARRSLFLLLLGCALATAAPLWPQVPRAAAPHLPLAYFYKPPSDGTSAAFLASHFQLLILTHADEPYRDQLRRAGFRGPILQNLASNEAEGPGPYRDAHAACDRSFPPYQRTPVDEPGLFCAQVHPHENWFLHNRRGERLYVHYRSGNGVWRTVYAMNPGAPGWRQFVIDRIRHYQSLGFDGLFLDNIALSLDGALREPHNHDGVTEYSSDREYAEAMRGYLAAIRHAFPHLILWANLVHPRHEVGEFRPFLPLLDGVMVEDFAVGWKSYALGAREQQTQFANIRDALAQGVNLLAVAQGRRDDPARLGYALACAWLLAPATAAPAADPDAARRGPSAHLYFRYADAFDQDYRTVWWFDAYTASPGQPLAPASQTGETWRRTFSGGTLAVNLEWRQVMTGAALLTAGADPHSVTDPATSAATSAARPAATDIAQHAATNTPPTAAEAATADPGLAPDPGPTNSPGVSTPSPASPASAGGAATTQPLAPSRLRSQP